VDISFPELLFGKNTYKSPKKASETCPNVFRAYQLAKNDYSIIENKHRFTKTCPLSMRASSSLELAELQCLKSYKRSLQMDLIIVPIDLGFQKP
jgi:hypothetical protein